MHVRKYSRFGLAFKKDFLIERGACPVFYVANESPVSANQVFSPDDFRARIEAARAKGRVDRALYFDTSIGRSSTSSQLSTVFVARRERETLKGFPRQNSNRDSHN
ncbi:hypothetical protein [Methylovirgula sp. HY1]|uniref:hypothetical protein n=1 Tax=Methylovirgula sp. HY1 TaxID=2822761 RepID=UPI00351CFA48